MARNLIKEWRNGRGGQWTARVRWYEGESDVQLVFEFGRRDQGAYIRLNRKAEIFTSEEAASKAFENFKFKQYVNW